MTTKSQSVRQLEELAVRMEGYGYPTAIIERAAERMDAFEKLVVQMAEEKSDLKDALDWALSKGVRYGYEYKDLRDYGCGCCSNDFSTTDAPRPVRELVQEKHDAQSVKG